MSTLSSNIRQTNLDILKIIAIICVIAIHVFDNLIIMQDQMPMETWNTVNQIESFIRLAVPTFFMMNGIFLLRNKKERGIDFYQKKFIPALLGYIAFSIFYSYQNYLFFNQTFTFESVLQDIFSFSSGYHLWFMRALLTVYLFVPIIRGMLILLKRGGMGKTLDVVMGIWFVTVILIPFLNLKFSIPEIQYVRAEWFTYGGYFVFGHYLYEYVTPILKKYPLLKYLSLLTSFVGMLLTATLTKELAITEPTFALNEYPYSPLSFNIFLTSTGLLLFALISKPLLKDSKILRFLSDHTLFLYYIHPVIISFYRVELGFDFFAFEPLSQANKLFAITLGLSLFFMIILYLIKKGLTLVVEKMNHFFTKSNQETKVES